MKRFVAIVCLCSFLSGVFGQSASSINSILTSRNAAGARSSAATTLNALKPTSNAKNSEFDGETFYLTADPQLAMSVPDYAVTAGDVYTLTFAMNTTPVVYTISVDTTYRIRVANLGVLNCKGLTYSQLKTQIDSLVSKNYPMGGVQFVLTSPSTFLVSVTGEVVKATERTAWALTRLSSFIADSLTDFSSVRNVTVISAEGEERNFDLYKAQREGDFSQDPYLRPGDKIVINRYDRRVMIKGAVERPGTYEILPGENLKALIEYYASGLQSLADVSRTTLYRVTDEKDSGKMLYLEQKDIESDFQLLLYDEVTIASYRDLTPAMFIEGAVSVANIAAGTAEAAGTARITVRFTDGENYASLVRRYSVAFTASSDLSAAYIIRGEKNIPIDLAQILYDASFYSSETAENGDTLLVPFRQFFVTVSGAVKNPSRFPYIPDRDWKYYVGLAGGIDTSRNSHEKMDILTIDGKELSKSDFITPEATIDVKENSFYYKWGTIAPTVTTLLSIVSTALSIFVVTQSLKN